MTERKPPGVSWESWVDRQVREARQRGDFDDLPGTGRPISDVDRPRDENWWLRKKLRRENVSFTPPVMKLRIVVEDAAARARAATTEAEVREILSAVNELIREANRMASSGPPSDLAPFDLDRAVEQWREVRAELVDDPGPGAPG